MIQRKSSTFYVYIVRCSDGSLYCGIAKNLERRMKEHNSQTKRAAKYTRSRQPVKLVYLELFRNRSEALRREYEIKTMDKASKEKLITS